MPNYDALRTSTLGALSYLCKKKPPAELLLCCPMVSSLSDISRYDKQVTYFADQSRFSITSNSGDYWLKFHSVGDDNPHEMIGYPLDISSADDFSFECFMWLDNGWGGTGFNFGGYKYCTYSYLWPSDYIRPFQGNNAIFHFALTRENGTVRYFVNGSCYNTVASSTNPVTSIILLTQDNGRDTRYTYVRNLRVVRKCLGTSSNYPVPAAPFTGYEPL